MLKKRVNFYWKFVIFLVFCWILYSDWFYNSLMNKSLLLVPCYNKWGNGGWESLRVLPKTAQLTRARALLSPPQGALSCLYWGAECLCHLLDFVPNAGDACSIPWVGKIPWRRAWQITPVFLPGESPWKEEPGRLQPMDSQRVWHDWETNTFTFKNLNPGVRLSNLKLKNWLPFYTRRELLKFFISVFLFLK